MPRHKKTRQNPAKLITHRGPEARARAYQMLGQGLTLSATARELGVDRNTVREWRDSLEGGEYLKRIREERAKQYEAIGEDNRRALREAGPRAVSILVDKLDSDLPFEAITAAKDILDRIGVLRGEHLELGGSAKVVVLPALEKPEDPE